jgi:DNA-binding NarL/FixJ family response regulator
MQTQFTFEMHMNISIAIVEDLDEVREGLANFISLNPDFLVTGAFSSAEDALKKIPAIQPDIVIMDINLPGKDGIQCIRELKNETPHTQFMMFTVYENDERVFEALKAGAASYLLKNTGLTQLTEALKELFHGGSPMSASIARKLISHFHNEHLQNNSINTLTQRENEILLLLAKGLLYKEIAEKLSIAVNTVRQHIHKIYEKLHVQNRTEAINKAFGKK